MQGRSMLMPAVWGGLVIGVFSALPFVSAFNLCCCLWVVVGGVLAAYVLQADTPTPIATGDGAVVGLLSGLVGALTYGVVSVPLNILFGPVQRRVMSRVLDQLPNVPPELRDAMQNAGSSEMAVVGAVMGVLMMMFVGAIFATAGGVIGALVFRKQTPAPPAVPDIPTFPAE